MEVVYGEHHITNEDKLAHCLLLKLALIKEFNIKGDEYRNAVGTARDIDKPVLKRKFDDYQNGRYRSLERPIGRELVRLEENLAIENGEVTILNEAIK